ncbi:SET domain-containing protein SmydA-8-like [Anopheles aquasalis]|uniref:SET domain-containing protein SmydA-8-like n=1 Tax=Anopheles aquasalis TaxID=42839 RepID=UPI00215ACB44|nr:SET domain-containing protein SmydA-8-like [Anopheles aquasalis]
MYSFVIGECLVKICSDEKLGRVLVATRDIQEGEIVLKESPLVHGPAQIVGPTCVGCLKPLEENKYLECERCGWPVCKRSCQNQSGHRAECELTVARGSKVSIQHFYVPHPLYQCLLPLRCLLLAESDPARWQALMRLQSHDEERRGSEQWRTDRRGVAQLIPRFFKCDNRWQEDDILRAIGIIQVNGHEVPLTEPASVTIYSVASMLEHSCRPNLAKSFSDQGEIILWAPVAIAQGTRLSISYTDVLWTTAQRRAHLLQTKLFSCACERCLDPTEFGTFFSAVRCSGFRTSDQSSQMCKGYLLPCDTSTQGSAVGDDDGAEWLCGRCHVKQPGTAVAQILDRARIDIQAMQKQREDHCVKYLRHYAKWLTPNHQYMVEAKMALSQAIGGSGRPEHIRKLPYGKLMSKIKACQELIALFEKLCPAESRAFGITRFELHAALAELGRRGMESNSRSNTPAAGLPLLQESLLNANECVRMLTHEPSVLLESKICAQARMNAETLGRLLAGRGRE